MSDDTGTDYELDVIALCCEYAADTFAEVAEQYSIDIEGLDDDEIAEAVEEYLQEHTLVAGTTKDGQIVYVQF
jgi:Holliday junction resolvasome RuvABC ATP-dependent DNA helicase subunit